MRCSGSPRPGSGFWAGIPLLALWGFASPAALGLMSHRVGPTEQGQLQGANASIMGIANLLGPGLFAQTLAYLDRRTAICRARRSCSRR